MGDRCRFDHPEDLDASKKDKTHNPIPRTYGEQYPRQRNTDTRKRNKSGRASDNRDRSVSGRHSTQTQNARREPENRRTRPTTHHTAANIKSQELKDTKPYDNSYQRMIDIITTSAEATIGQRRCQSKHDLVVNDKQVKAARREKITKKIIIKTRN